VRQPKGDLSGSEVDYRRLDQMLGPSWPPQPEIPDAARPIRRRFAADVSGSSAGGQRIPQR